jgi:sugar phosphate isomerase/epimerase
MKLGLSTYTYTWAVGVPGNIPETPLTAENFIDKAFAAGIQLVQIADNLPLECWTTEALHDLLDYASSRGINIEMGSRGLTPEHTLQCLKSAEILKSPILRMVIDQKDYEPDLQTIISIVKDLVPEFKSRNIRLAIENHDRLKAAEFEKIINAVNSEWIGICLDSVNSMGAGEGFETVSEILLPYTINLHLKDFCIKRVSHKMGFVIEGTPAGQGMLNISHLIGSLKKYNKCNSAILELWTPRQSSTEETIELENAWAEQSLLFLKPLVN